ncbi:hypothetical protein ID866_7930 [Astraeus odoratus]|nr:hypothetical protein ID866_7930 [Astraeus odoratus]
MRYLSIAAHALKPFLDGSVQPLIDARDLPRPDPYDGI